MRKLTAAETKTMRDKIAMAQGNLCPLCGGDFKEAKLVKRKLKPKLIKVLDHDHATGVIRGVLCNNCNGMEGQISNRANRAKRNITALQWLRNLVGYLETCEKAQSSLIYHTHKTEDQKRLLRNKRARNKRAAIKAATIIRENTHGKN